MKRLLAVLLVLCALLTTGCAEKYLWSAVESEMSSAAEASAAEKEASSAAETPAAEPEAPPAAETPAAEQEESAAETPAALPDNWNPDIRFSTADTNGNRWTDACFAEHELTMINLWAYWCGPCISELPDLQKISEEYASEGVLVLGIGNVGDEVKNIKKMKSLGVTYPCLRYTSAFDSYLNTGYIPTTIFVDKDGKVVGEALIGSRGYDDWVKVIKEKLK